MKKYFYLLLTIVLFTPMIVFGDEAGPNILGYDAIVINPNGAETYDVFGSEKNDKKISYNTKVHVVNEYDGYAGICLDGNDCWKGDYSVKMSDILPLQEEYIPSNKDLSKDYGIVKYETEIIVSNKNGIKLLKGPSEIYSKYDILVPYKTSITSKYAVATGGEGESIDYYYLYVDNGTYKGWIYQYSGDVFVKIDNDVLSFVNIDLLDDNGKKILTLPSATTLDKVYYGGDFGTYGTYFIKSNGKEGIFKRESYDDFYGKKIENGYVLTIKNTKITSENGKNIDVPVGKKINVLYSNDYSPAPGANAISPFKVCIDDDKCYYYVEYNNNRGFINSSDVEPLIFNYKQKTFLVNKNTEMYDINKLKYSDVIENSGKNISDYLIESKVNKVIPANTSLTLYDDISIYVKDENNEYKFGLVSYNGKVGYILLNNDIQETNNSINSDDNQENNNIDVNNKNNENNTINETKPSVQKKSNDTLIYAILGGVIVSLVGVIIVLLVNKNKGVKGKVSSDVKKENTNIETNNEQELIKINNEKDTEKKD